MIAEPLILGSWEDWIDAPQLGQFFAILFVPIRILFDLFIGLLVSLDIAGFCVTGSISETTNPAFSTLGYKTKIAPETVKSGRDFIAGGSH